MTDPKIEILLSLNPQKRENLLDDLSKQNLNQRTLDAMNKIPREYFLSENLYEYAYEDKALPIDDMQTISQPYTVAFMTDLADIISGMKVLEVGTGSGYQSIILYYMGAEVYTIERIENLFQKSQQTFRDFDVNIKGVYGDGSQGLPEYAPFDRIIVTAGSPKIPENLKKQLYLGGIMIIPVGDKNYQKMLKIQKTGTDTYDISEHSTFRFVPLIGKSGWKG